MGAGVPLPGRVRDLGVVLPEDRGPLGAARPRRAARGPCPLGPRYDVSVPGLGMGTRGTWRRRGRSSPGFAHHAGIRRDLPRRRVLAHGCAVPRAPLEPCAGERGRSGALPCDSGAHPVFRHVAPGLAGRRTRRPSRAWRGHGPERRPAAAVQCPSQARHATGFIKIPTKCPSRETPVKLPPRKIHEDADGYGEHRHVGLCRRPLYPARLRRASERAL
jgi:hypothetical protein